MSASSMSAASSTPPDLTAVVSPTHFVWGDSDPFGSVELGRRLVAAMPEAELEVMPQTGHLPWFDDPDHAADAVRWHLLD